MHKRVALFWPADAREISNEMAQPTIEETTRKLERALQKLGREPYRIDGFLSKPHLAIEKLGPIDDPMIGVYAHWVFGPHTTDGVVGKTTLQPGRSGVAARAGLLFFRAGYRDHMRVVFCRRGHHRHRAPVPQRHHLSRGERNGMG